MEFFRQEYWSGYHFPSPRDLSDPGLNLGPLHYRQILYHLRHQGSPLYTVLYVKYTKAQQLIEDAHMWQPTPDMWTNSRDCTCEPMFQSLKFTIWRIICRGLTVCTVGYLWTCTVQICIFQGSFFGFEFVWKPSLYFCILTIYTSLLWELLTIFTLNFSLLLALHCDDLKLLGSLCTSYPKKAIVDFYCASI